MDNNYTVKGYIHSYIDYAKQSVKRPGILILSLATTLIISIIQHSLAMKTASDNITSGSARVGMFLYANGGMYGGFFGFLGGAVGRILFIMLINSIVLGIATKQHPLKSFFEGIGRSFSGFKFKRALDFHAWCFGFGSALIIYTICNATQNRMNGMIGAYLLIMVLGSLGRRNSFLYGLFLRMFLGKRINDRASEQTVLSLMGGSATGYLLGTVFCMCGGGTGLWLGIIVFIPACICFLIGVKKLPVMALFLIMSLIVPCVSVKAETYPAEAFEGTWHKSSHLDHETGDYTDMDFSTTIEISGDVISINDSQEIVQHDNVDGRFWITKQDSLLITNVYVSASGSYTYDEQSGILTANLSGTKTIENKSELPGAQNSTTEEPWSGTHSYVLKTINELVPIGTDGEEGTVYTRTSETPVFTAEPEPVPEELEETEEIETEETEIEEETENDIGEDEIEERSEEDLEEEIEFEEEPEVADKDSDKFIDDFYKYYFNVDDVHLDKMKTAAADAGISMMALAFAFASAGSAGFGGFGGAGALGGGFPGGPGSVEGGFSGGEYPGQNPDVPTENQYGNGFEPEETSLEKEARRLEIENREWMQKQREANNRLSQEAKDWSAQKAADEKAWQREQKRNELFYKHGNWDKDYNKYKKDWIKERMNEAEVSGKLLQRAEYMDASAKTAENVKKGCDIAIDICAELEPTGTGKQIKNIYKASAEFAGQFGEVTAGKQKIGQALAKTVYNTSIEYIKDNLDDEGFGGQVKKFFANTECEAWKGYVNAAIDGKSHEECLEKAREGYKDGFKSWAIDTAIGTVAKTVTKGADLTDLTGYKINGIYRMKDIKGDDAAKWASKLFDTGFVKEAVTNDNVTSTVSTFVSDITQELFGGDDDD